jgi:hypothetical protein
MLAYKFYLHDAMKNCFDYVGGLLERRRMKKLWSFSLVVISFCAFVANAHAVKFIEIADGSFAESGEGDVIVFTKGGKPILPDLEKSRGKRPPVQKNEISFTFNSPEYPWSAEELATLQQWVDDLYPVMKKIYGSPAFSISVNVSKNPTISSAGYYYSGSNEAILRKLAIDVLCHEIIHAFHDDLVIYADIFEEGLTRAAEIAVLAYLPQYHHLWPTNPFDGIDVFYEMNNQPEIASFGGYFSNGFVNILMRYQQAGYAWGKIYLEDQRFFKKFNAQYYFKALNDPSFNQSDVEKLKNIAGTIKRTVEKQKFNVWYGEQHIFNTDPEEGYQTVFKGDNNTLYVFSRVDGWETMLSGVNVSWEIFSCQGAYLSSGSAVTGAYGWVEIPVWQPAYQGKVQIDVRVDLSPDATIERSIITLNGVRAGIFGVTSACEGEVKIGGQMGSSALVVNGAFSIPELENMAGTFKVNQGKNGKTVTKDAGDYFVSVP